MRNRLSIFAIQSRIIIDFGYIMLDANNRTPDGLELSINGTNTFSQIKGDKKGLVGIKVMNNSPIDFIDLYYANVNGGYDYSKRFFIVTYNTVNEPHLYTKSVEEVTIIEEFKIEDFIIDNLPCLAAKDIAVVSNLFSWDNTYLEVFNAFIKWNEYSASNVVTESNLEKFGKKIDWKKALSSPYISEEFIDKHIDKADGVNISKRVNITDGFLKKHENILDWDIISKNVALSNETIKIFEKNINFKELSKNKNIPLETIIKYKDVLDWAYLSKELVLTDELINDLVDVLDINGVYSNTKIEDDIKEYFYDLVDWDNLLMNGVLNQNLIEKFQDRLAHINQSFINKLEG